MSDATPESIARWMLSSVEEEGCLYQADAVAEIGERFGQQFTDLNDRGNRVIGEPILEAFRDITGDTVIWDRGERCWRKREADDAPGRTARA
jgi:hypothetical protein